MSGLRQKTGSGSIIHLRSRQQQTAAGASNVLGHARGLQTCTSHYAQVYRTTLEAVKVWQPGF